MGLKSRSSPVTWNAAIEERLRVALGPRPDVNVKRMFGGLCFMVGGHMTVGLADDHAMARVGPDGYDAALQLADARAVYGAFRPMKGIVWVAPSGLGSQRAVNAWVKRALKFTEALPPR